MPITATVFNVLIASPSDVPEERNAIAQTLHEWNALNTEETGKVLLPVMWESHSAPVMEGHPQETINNQVVSHCDMLIGAFWTRLGSPTGMESSGTVEEIKWFLKKNQPVMLYYSRAQVDVEIIDTKQLDSLKEFKKSIRDKGIQETYASIGELKQKLSRQLTIVMRGMSVGTTVTATVVKEARESSNKNENAVASNMPVPKEDSFVLATSNNVNHDASNSAAIWLEDYNDKSFMVLGNTFSKKDQIKDLGGRYMSTKDGKKGWNFAKSKLELIAKSLNVLPDLRKKLNSYLYHDDTIVVSCNFYLWLEAIY